MHDLHSLLLWKFNETIIKLNIQLKCSEFFFFWEEISAQSYLQIVATSLIRFWSCETKHPLASKYFILPLSHILLFCLKDSSFLGNVTILFQIKRYRFSTLPFFNFLLMNIVLKINVLFTLNSKK